MHVLLVQVLLVIVLPVHVLLVYVLPVFVLLMHVIQNLVIQIHVLQGIVLKVIRIKVSYIRNTSYIIQKIIPTAYCTDERTESKNP